MAISSFDRKFEIKTTFAEIQDEEYTNHNLLRIKFNPLHSNSNRFLIILTRTSGSILLPYFLPDRSAKIPSVSTISAPSESL